MFRCKGGPRVDAGGLCIDAWGGSHQLLLQMFLLW